MVSSNPVGRFDMSDSTDNLCCVCGGPKPKKFSNGRHRPPRLKTCSPECGKAYAVQHKALRDSDYDGRTARFWAKVIKSDSGCWEWTGTRNENGYGLGGMKFSGGGREALAHRTAWTLVHGPIPENSCVLHACDNPLCVNPSHLSLGSQRDNMLDMRAKGRGWHGGSRRKVL